MHQAFHAVAGEPFSTYISGGLTRRTDLAGLNLSRVPAIFIECANMRNAADARRLTSPAWRQKAAAGIVAGPHGVPAPLASRSWRTTPSMT